MKQSMEISRRRFLQGTTASLVLGMYLPMLSKNALAKNATDQLTANAFVKIASDSTVTVLIKHIEFGQGAFTGLASLVAEELNADWSQMRAEHAPANAELYKNIFFGDLQGTGGSTGLANSYLTMRQAGASAKALLIAAAAKMWGIDVKQITIENGLVKHVSSGHQATFGELVAIANTLPLPTAAPNLKSPDQFKFIGKDLAKLDTLDKTLGQTQYTQDIHIERMLTAVVAHPPLFGAKLQTVDDSATRKIVGVIDVKRLPNGVAVYAKNTFSAIKGRNALKLTWDTTQAETRSSPKLVQLFSQTAKQDGLSVVNKGDAKQVLSQAKNSVNIELQFPYLAHAPMEPLDAVMLQQGDKISCWFGCQMPTIDQQAIAQVFSVPPSNVNIQTQLAGGSFGRRVTQDSSFAIEAALVTRSYGNGVPIKTVWTREDDIQGGYYRPMSVHNISTAIGNNGEIQAWKHTIAVQSLLKGSPFEAMMENGIDPSSVEGVSDLRYEVPNLDVSVHNMEVGVPVLWWRSVGHTHTAYAVETVIDILLERTERDPINGRIALLGDKPREIGVLKAVKVLADKAGDIPQGRARGVAVVQSFGSYVAQIAEVSKGDNGLPKVHRVWCAVDCGLAVNPNIIKAQMEGGLGFGLDAILYGEISLDNSGKVEQTNFHNYATLRINNMPQVEVMIIASEAAPSGVGEPGTPPIGPAVSNAWRRLTGQYVTTLPFSKGVKLA
jgi:isoquinoline 1-oxidoreductase subunit beta